MTVRDVSRKTTAEQGMLEGVFDLLPIQSWFFEKHLPCAWHWNQSFLVRVPPLSIERLNEILLKLVQHHDMLRAHFQEMSSGDRRQVYGSLGNLPLIEVMDVSTISEEERIDALTHWQNNFNLESSPLWRLGYLFGYADGSARLYFAFHHLIIDAVSWRILISDIKRLYDNDSLGEKSSSYRQWVAEIKSYPDQYPDELTYWQNVQPSKLCA